MSCPLSTVAAVPAPRRRIRPGARPLAWLAILLLVPAAAASAQSVFTTRPDDPAAIHLAAPAFAVRGDGAADDSAAIQAAIDQAGSSFSGGLVFIPSGRYRLTRTVYLWRGVRVVGYGATRPVFVLGDDTPGFQQGVGVMVMFTGGGPVAPVLPSGPAGAPGQAGGGRGGGRGRVPFPPPGSVPPDERIADANQGTFYPGMTNIDFAIGRGNPAAVAIRFHVAQHGILNHMTFDVGSGLAALTQIGNEVQDLHIRGGRFGILTENTSPYWPFVVVDSVFEGQREAAIREYMAGLTVVRTTFRNVPVGIEIARAYSDQLWVKDSRFENVSGAAVLISNEKNAMTQVGFANVACAGVPVFARFRESGKTVAGRGASYLVASFSHGLAVPLGGSGEIETRYDAAPLAAMPAPMAPAIRPLPGSDAWTNVRALGVKGDGQTDDTDAIRKAIEAHRVLYFPSGYYVVRDTITLKPETTMIALHPGLTQFLLPDRAAGYQGVGSARAVLTAPQGGRNIVSGLGIFTGGINPRATGILWMAGEDSLLDDIQFHGFAGSTLPPAVRTALYPPGGGRGQFAAGRWGAQYPSLWVTRGGGGTFNNIWSPNTYAQSGFYVSDTTTPGHVYQLSVEHHLFGEIKLDRVENWDFNAPQTEEEAQSSPEAVAFEINRSRNITIANYHAYRVARNRQPFASAVRLTNSSDIHFRNLHAKSESGYAVCDANGCGRFLRAGKFPFENAVQDVTRHLEVREREFAVLDVPAAAAAPPARGAAVVTSPVKKLEDGFFTIAGAAVDAAGTLYFVDHHQHRIFSWSAARGLAVVRDAPHDPVNLAVAKSGDVLVVSSAGPEGTVYTFNPARPADEINVLEPQPAAPPSNAAVVLPVNVWVNGELEDQLDPATYEYVTLPQLFARDVGTPAPRQYVSPDGSLVLPAGRVFQQPGVDSYAGMDETGWRWSHNLDAYGLVTASPGRRVFVISGAENRTYRAAVQANGTLGDLQPFAERGGESVVADSAGNVYIANGQVFVHDASGKLTGRIDVPERPVQLLFGGADRRTLFILTHRALYSVTTRVPGEATPWGK
ncbi:MAG TPA: glycosyl hydrolase family 28-related protein [Vicinamibacterales bacterium]|nr:glycosyl hydrolase family 28-related protein [Vicinamibacterales bacterium]